MISTIINPAFALSRSLVFVLRYVARIVLKGAIRNSHPGSTGLRYANRTNENVPVPLCVRYFAAAAVQVVFLGYSFADTSINTRSVLSLDETTTPETPITEWYRPSQSELAIEKFFNVLNRLSGDGGEYLASSFISSQLKAQNGEGQLFLDVYDVQSTIGSAEVPTVRIVCGNGYVFDNSNNKSWWDSNPSPTKSFDFPYGQAIYEACLVNPCVDGQVYDSESGLCVVNPKNAPNGCPTAGNPVAMATGNKFSSVYLGTVGEDIELMYIHSGSPGSEVAHGMSQLGSLGSYRSLDVNLREGQVIAKRPNGQEIVFINASKVWVADPNLQYVLSEMYEGNNSQTGWTLTGNGWEENYTLDGRITEVTRNGQLILTFGYDPDNRLESLTNKYGQYINIHYGAEGLVDQILDHSGRAWGLSYDVSNNLEYVSLPDGNVKQFHYEYAGMPHVLTGITDERGIRYATYEYYADGRSKASYHAGNAQRVDITYDTTTGTRTVTNSRGQSTTYTTDVNLGTALVTGISGPGCSTCANGGDTSYEYDRANNNLLTKTENGFTTQYGDYGNSGDSIPISVAALFAKQLE